MGPATSSVDHAQGRYTVVVREARTGEAVISGTVDGEDDVECSLRIAAREGEAEETRYTSPDWEQYGHVVADLRDAKSAKP